MKPAAKKMNGRVLFLIFVLLLYGLTAIFNLAMAKASLVYFGEILTKVIPVLSMVFVFVFLLNLLAKPDWIRDHIGAKSGLKGWLYAVVGGILISGPPYLIYPMLGELKKYGARSSLLAAILYNRNVKPQFLPAMIYYFGIKYTVVLSIYIILFSLLNGKILEMIIHEPGRLADPGRNQ